MGGRFQRRVESFTCSHCGAKVSGDGYTNHCPCCLWSRHVDIWPGDRSHDCRGMMKPCKVELEHGQLIIVHRCIQCGEEKRNKSRDGDDQDVMLQLMRRSGFEKV